MGIMEKKVETTIVSQAYILGVIQGCTIGVI